MKNDASWMDSALCRQVDPNLFFAEAGEGQRRQIADAIKICASCPVRIQCEEYARKFARGWGVWAGVNRGSRPPGRPSKVVEDFPNHGTDAGTARHRRRGETPCRACLKASALAQSLRKEKRQA